MNDDIDLSPYTGRWDEDDPDANFKREVAEYTRTDPLPTFRTLASNTGIPVGSLIRFALVKWAAEGSEALLALGPRTVERLWRQVEEAERTGTDEARLAAYEALRAMLSWLRVPLSSSSTSAADPTGRPNR